MSAPHGNRQRHVYAFEAFVLDEQEHTLQRDGEAVALAPKAFEMLLVLVRHAGQSLNKDELMAKVWPDTFVEEANLAVHISMLRRALGERPGGGQYIETLPRRGYRFAAEVREFDEDLEIGQSQPPLMSASQLHLASATAPAVLPPVRSNNRRAVSRADLAYLTGHKTAVALAIGIAALGLATLAYFASRKTPSRGAGGIYKLAVLPFINKGPGGQPFDYGVMLADSVINKLGMVRALIVRPTSYVERYADVEVKPEQVAQDLDVNILLMGSYIVDGDDVRVDAQLFEIENQALLWVETINVKKARMIELQDYVAQQVVRGLRVQLSNKEDERLNQSVSVDPQAYTNYAKSRYLMSTNTHREAMRLLTEAVEIDPNFVLGWTYRARAYHINALQFSGTRDDLSNAEAFYQQALALDPEQPQARLMYAKFLTETGRVEESAPRLLALLADNPNLGEAHWELSYAYRYAGLLTESIVEGERAQELDRRLQSHQFNSYLYSGQYEKFLASLPIQETAYVMFYRGLAYYYLNNLDKAARAFDRAYELNPSSVISQIGKAMQLAVEGKRREGLTLLQEAEAKITQAGAGDGEIAYKFAQAYDALDHREAAVRALKRSIEQGFFCYPYIAADPLLKNIRGQEFDAILEKARQRHDAFRRRIADINSSALQH